MPDQKAAEVASYSFAAPISEIKPREHNNMAKRCKTLVSPEDDINVRAIYFDAEARRSERPTNGPHAYKATPEVYEVEFSEMARHVEAVSDWMRSATA
jgi:hypothetical protein